MVLFMFSLLVASAADDAVVQVSALRGASVRSVANADRGNPTRIAVGEHVMAGPLWLDCWGPLDSDGYASCRWLAATAAELADATIGTAALSVPFATTGSVVKANIDPLMKNSRR
ncbi:MAG: putative membrane protein [Myxococcota bacterium]|jgi:uncharacterized membrane protein